ncbi:PREDICTED: uncharacterized protein LOC104593480 isoform X2 [Nelumbo nucifera]|uniref:Uncharacterized protein LOC104593480 isoform X2 n=1 Tax=Nelumbo nucifera TaxID=4432 RepID=A0A1U7ZDD6_NELNU|nr:PREDICTED: uncharacterized protein LOC104593480 isoform X2 [Nelumbo nucifera]
MAVSAFKSMSKRGSLGTPSTNLASAAESNSENLGKKVLHRRSRSVSAFSRNSLETPSSSQLPSTDKEEFLNKRDNPLFWSSTSPPRGSTETENVIGIAKFDSSASRLGRPASNVSDTRRGRSVSRNSGYVNTSSGNRKEVGRSLSRVDTGRRRRSASRGRYGNSESEVEQDYNLSSSIKTRNNGNLGRSIEKKDNLITNASELSDQTKNMQTWSSQHPLLEPSDGLIIPNWEDGISTRSYSEAEEKTIKAVFEQMKSLQSPASDAGTSGIYETVRSEVRRAISEVQNDLENAIRRKNPSIIGTTNIADIPPELVNPDAVELVSDIRREYARKLEESQERARKLREDLAVEEHRGQELSRILKEILPDPKVPNIHKSRPRRRNSIERRKISKRLTEEAMNYFDECVSISTFDSSDFSSPEDPPPVVTSSVSDGRFFACGSPSASTTYCSNVHLNHKKESANQVECTPSHEVSVLTAGSSSEEPKNDQGSLAGIREQMGTFRFSFAHEPTETLGLHHDIRNYVKRFEKEIHKDTGECQIARSSSYDADDYKLQVSAESLLFDKVIFKNRIESGSLLLCFGGIAI